MDKLVELGNRIYRKEWFARRHYDAIADLLRYGVQNDIGAGIEFTRVCDKLCILFSDDNPRFQPDRFMEACGVSVWDKRIENIPSDVATLFYREGLDYIDGPTLEEYNG